MVQASTSDDHTDDLSPSVSSYEPHPPIANGTGTSQSGSLGLLDPTLSQARRRKLNVINKLHSLGVQLDISIPQIVVIGMQSVGKSSLIESISGITLPRSHGTCTRCPTECHLVHSNKPWECRVSVRFLTDFSGHPLQEVRNVLFGLPIRDPADLEEQIRRAQRAALNPDFDPQVFLDPTTSPLTDALNFTTNYVSLEISGPDVTDLSFLDLPGLIASTTSGRDEDVGKVTDLVSSYISRPSCIILLAVTCESDFENQGAYRLAMQYDTRGTRTIGVLTKPDRIAFGEEDRWFKLIKNESSPLKNGWYCVKQPSSQELSEKPTSNEARCRGEAFFNQFPWSALNPGDKNKLGTRALTQKLNDHLIAVISKRLPEIPKEIQKLLQQTKDDLQKLPAPAFKDPIMEMMHLIGDFSDDMFRHAEGLSYSISGSSTAEGDNQFELIRFAHEDFRLKMRSTAPDFRPFDRGEEHIADMSNNTTPPFLIAEEQAVFPCSSDPIYRDDVVRRVQRATTRELPGYYPFQVLQDLISVSSSQWEEPARVLVESIYLIVIEHHNRLIDQHFGEYASGKLPQSVSMIMQEHTQKRRDEAIERVKWLLELEAYAFTLHQYCLDDYRGKFLEYYKTQRRDQLHRYSPCPPEEPWNPSQYGLEIMATVRAYFQVAYKRVVDTLPLAIDRELVRVKKRDVQEAISVGIGITGSEAQQQCEKLLAEPPEVVHRREDLRNRIERLTKAQNELMNIS